MDLSFTKVNYDRELSELSEDELRELVAEYEDAQESNVAEFEKAAEAIDEVDGDVDEFNQAREKLVTEITDADQFSEVPLTEEQLEDQDFSQLQEWRDFVQTSGEADESDEADGDFGQRAPKTWDTNETEDLVEQELSSIPGLNT